MMNKENKQKSNAEVAGRREFTLLCLDGLEDLEQKERLEQLDNAI